MVLEVTSLAASPEWRQAGQWAQGHQPEPRLEMPPNGLGRRWQYDPVQGQEPRGGDLPIVSFLHCAGRTASRQLFGSSSPDAAAPWACSRVNSLLAHSRERACGFHLKINLVVHKILEYLKCCSLVSVTKRCCPSTWWGPNHPSLVQNSCLSPACKSCSLSSSLKLDIFTKRCLSVYHPRYMVCPPFL